MPFSRTTLSCIGIAESQPVRPSQSRPVALASVARMHSTASAPEEKWPFLGAFPTLFVPSLSW